MQNNVKQTIVIGASAAGISAAIYLKRSNIDFLLISKDIGGEMLTSGIVENYPGFLKTNGFELTQKFEEHLKYYDIEVKNDKEVVSIEKVNSDDKKNNFFKITTNDGEFFYSYSLIIATGSKPKKLNVPGEDKLKNKGVSYCSVCDGPLFKNKIVAVVGGGNSANESGILLSDIAQKVYVITKNEKMKGDQILINQLLNKKNVELITLGLTQEILGEDKVEGLVYLDLKENRNKEIKVDGVFIHIGMIPNTYFIPKEWGILNEYGEIEVNKLMETKIEGIFAAGDVTDTPFKQIGIAVGQGIIAALSNVRYLNQKRGYPAD